MNNVKRPRSIMMRLTLTYVCKHQHCRTRGKYKFNKFINLIISKQQNRNNSKQKKKLFESGITESTTKVRCQNIRATY